MQFDRDEPSVDSKDREERIRARRARIHEKMEINNDNPSIRNYLIYSKGEW